MLKIALATFLISLASVKTVSSEPFLIDDFQSKPEQHWSFFTDTVMGGVSRGSVKFETENGNAFAKLTGSVSTANNGGFIQIRRNLDSVPPEEIRGLRLKVKGNNQRYFIHVRTSGTVLPWQYYQAPFDASPDWREVRLDLSAFKPSGSMLRKTIKPKSMRSVAIVAYGRDHNADVQVSEIGYF